MLSAPQFSYWCSPRAKSRAKRTTLNLELESNTDRLLQEKDDLLPQSVTNSSDEGMLSLR